MPDIPAIPPDTIIESTTTYIYGNAECQHKWHWKTKVGFADMLAVCAFVMEFPVRTILLPKMVSAVQLRSVECAVVSAEFFTSQTLFPEGEVTGGLPELGVMPIVANVWQFRTGTAGRRGRGRMYMFGFPQAFVENYHKLTPYAVTQFRLLANDWESQFGLTGSDPFMSNGVFSRRAYHFSHDVDSSFAQLKFINIQSRLSSCSKRRS